MDVVNDSNPAGVVKIKYLCGSCGNDESLGPHDPIQCRSCGYRILYKVRTKRMVQHEAR